MQTTRDGGYLATGQKIVEQHHYSNYEEMLEDYQSIIKSKNIIIIMLLGNIIFMHFIIIVI